MNFYTMFELGDEVFVLTETAERNWVRCGFCVGSTERILSDEKPSMVEGEDGTFMTCPRCHGMGGQYSFINKRWEVAGKMNIIEIQMSCSDKRDGVHEEYTCRDGEDGCFYKFGFKEMYYEKGDAEMECGRRNQVSG